MQPVNGFFKLAEELSGKRIKDKIKNRFPFLQEKEKISKIFLMNGTIKIEKEERMILC